MLQHCVSAYVTALCFNICYNGVSAYKNLIENKLQNRNMRILNIIFNAEIKYQQYAKLRKYRHKDIWSNFDPGKTHKGKTSERGLCIIYELLRNYFTAYSSSDIYTNLSRHSCSFAPRCLNQKFIQLYGCPSN
jgi:hypothetical protein